MPIQIDDINYNKFGTEQTLLPNNKYRVLLELDNLIVDFSFTSKFDPLYANTDIIKGDIGPFIADLSDNDINQQIHSVSVEAQNIAYNENEFLGEDAFDFDSPPYHVKQYVRYKAEYNLAKKQYMNMAKSAGSKKDLGKLSIDHGYDLGDLKDLLKMLREEITPWARELRGGRPGTVYAVRAGNHDSPLTIERTGF